MAKTVFKTLGVTAGLTTAMVLTGLSTQTFAMAPFQANYQFSYNGKNMGSATRTLSKSGNNWTYVLQPKQVVLLRRLKPAVSLLIMARLVQAVSAVPVRFWCIAIP